MTSLLASEGVFPPIGHILEWPDVAFKDTAFALNKIGISCLFAAFLTLLLFVLAGRQRKLVPTGVQNFVESIVDFVDGGVVKQAMGHGGEKYLPLLLSLFCFIFLTNIVGIIPGWQMPATARMAIPLMLAVVAWVTFMGVGLIKQGPAYFGHLIWPPGVPVALKPLVGLIEFISTIFVRPFSLAVRLFANLLAGHILLVTFASLTNALINAQTAAFKPIAILPFIMLVVMTGFEMGVALLQAYIFTILTAVYIDSSMHPEH